MKLNDIILKYNLENVWYASTLYINVYIVLSITCIDNSKNMKKYCLFIMPICIVIQILKKDYILFAIIDVLYFYILAIIYKVVRRGNIYFSNYLFITIFSVIFQMISLSTRNISIISRVQNNFIISTILSLDYIFICIIFYKFYFMNGGKTIWEMVLGYGSHLMMELKKLQRKFLKKLRTKRKKKLTKQEKVYYLIFYPFVLIYNLFTMLIIFLISYILDSVVECIFITISFWINKSAFGKPFHAKDSKTCFIISSISYIILNKLASGTIGISYLWQVVLGVMFSYLTSRFVKNTSNKLHKGMSKEEFDELILQIETIDSLNYKICYMYYVERKSELEVSNKVGYCVDNIKKIKGKVNKKLKEL